MSATPHTTRRKRVPKKFAATIAAGAVLGGTAASAAPEPQRPALDPSQVCNLHTVVSGDTMSLVAKRAGITLDDFINRNRHVINPNRIWPGDVLVINCEQRTVTVTTTAPTTIVPSSPAPTAPPAEVQRVAKGPDVEKWRGEMETCTDGNGKKYQCLTWRAITAELYVAGFRGNDLINMAAITPCESGRDPWRKNETHTDRDMANGWLGSYGLGQVRARVEETGTGNARDRDALMGSVAHQAWALHEIYLAALKKEEAGYTIIPARLPDGTKQAKRQYNRFDPWTCFQIHHHDAFIEDATAGATEIGALS